MIVKYLRSIHLFDPLISLPKISVKNKRIRKNENKIMVIDLIFVESKKEIIKHKARPIIR
tara:strand:+ start:1498 stop:1677 length:180 start_codon:yes stop_codon:yes gene_type:complete